MTDGAPARPGLSVPLAGGLIVVTCALWMTMDSIAKHLGREMQTESAQARSLDSILRERADRKVQLVKLDVDGFECDVLRGATSLLRDTRPVFVMELAPYVLEERGASLDQLLAYFIPNGYVFYDERTEKRLPSEAKELQRMLADGESMNVIARVA